MFTSTKLKVLLLSLPLLVLGCDLGGSEPDPPEPSPVEQVPDAATTWLLEEGHEVKTTDPTAGLGDLEPLREIVGDARVVALGEATHGTREFFQMKHRILRYLVEEMDFTAFAIEATMPESFRVNDYVRTGAGDPAERLENLYFWTWNTEEVLNQIKWMREYNEQNDPDIGFYGFDMQYPEMAMEVVVNYFEEVDPDTVNTVQSHYACYSRYQGQNAPDYESIPDSTQQKCRDGIQAVSEILEAKRESYIARSSKKEYSFSRQHARLVEQAEEDERNADQNIRDLAMAENVLWLLDYLGPESKLVLWAHNGHVSEAGLRYTSMGTHLDDALGDELLTLGFSFYEGQIHAVEYLGDGRYGGLSTLRVPPPPSDSTNYFEHYFASVDAEQLLVDLRLAQEGTDESGWVHDSKQLRSIGAVYAPHQAERYFYASDLPAEFDVMLHIQQSTPTRLR